MGLERGLVFTGGWRARRLVLVFVALVLLPSNAFGQALDADRDGLDDAWEQRYFRDLSQGIDGDPDGDGLYNQQELQFGTDPTRFDTDEDVLSDRRERDLGTNPLRADSDRDGLTDYGEVEWHHTDPQRRDTDGGGRGDGEEVLLDGSNPLDANDDRQDSDGDGLTNELELRLGTNPFSIDTDGDLLTDSEEDANLDDRYQGDINENGIYEPELGEETDPVRADTDGDGLDDGLEFFFGADPFDLDSDDDGYSDGDEYHLRQTGFPCLDPSNEDSDFDGVNDGVELDAGMNACNPDSDGDTVPDIIELETGTDPLVPDALPDADGDGLSDVYESTVTGTDPNLADSDGDGLSDVEELYPLADRSVTNPRDADTDDDGLLDGNEPNAAGFTSPVDPDTDHDGLSDGLERGLATPEISALDPDATDLGLFTPDTDTSTVTEPLRRDSDGDLLDDGAEDDNHDGFVSPGETDPNVFDTDRDGMDDAWEVRYAPDGECPDGTTVFLDPTLADAGGDGDGDGLSNLTEYLLEVRLGLDMVRSSTSPCDADSDDDGLSDSVEATSLYPNGQTDPNDPDTDGDGLGDGLEDADADGEKALVETDSTNPDSDGDGLRDAVEDANGNGSVDAGETDPRIFDTDADGVGDGSEVQQYGTDPLDPDSDGDDILDGVELGTALDADPSTVSDPRSTDSDADGLEDGDEDRNANGRRDADETDPTDYDTDDGGVSDGVEVPRGTNPLDPSDDGEASGPGWNPSGGADAGTSPGGASGASEPGSLEPNAEIRGSALCGLGVPQAPPGGPRLPWSWFGLVAVLGWRTRRRSAARRTRRAAAWLARVPWLGGALWLGLGAFLARPASAQVNSSARNTNIDANPHRLDPSGYDLLGTSRPRVLPHLAVRGAALLNHLSGPAVVVDRDSGETLRSLVGNREEIALGASLGLFDRAQLSVMLPAVVHQSAELPGQGLEATSSSGLGNLTLVPRAVLYESRGGSLRLGVETPVTLPLWDTPAYMGYEGWGVEPRLLAEQLAGPVVISVALGALFKPDQHVFDLEDGDQLTYAVAGQYPDALRGWDFGVEFQGATPFDAPGRSSATRGELLGGARARVDDRLSFTGGAGVGLFSGIGQPRYRLFVAVGYALLGATPEAMTAPDCSVKPGETPPPGCAPLADRDADGVGDGSDTCPAEAEDRDGFQDADGCPDPDNDGDGALDADDGCPSEAEDRDGFKDADGCPDPDNDGDGVLDTADQCRLEPEDLDGDRDADGCPEVTLDAAGAALAPSVAQRCPDGSAATEKGECHTQMERLDPRMGRFTDAIRFADHTDRLMDSSRASLDQVVDFLDANPTLQVLIVGHTDSRGDYEQNIYLAQLRATRVRTYLLEQSRNPRDLAKRVEAVGKGPTEPTDSNDTAVGRSRNRRVEFLIVEQLPTTVRADVAPPIDLDALPDDEQ